MATKKTPPMARTVETIQHEDATRKNIPTMEYQAMLQPETQAPLRVAYERRNRDLDPQLVWRGKDEQDWSELVVQAPPLYIQESIHPRALIQDLLDSTAQAKAQAPQAQVDLFGNFHVMSHEVDKTEFYQHDQNWSNRMILGDSLQVMASLAEREGLQGKVQCIYMDPPYGIKFNSNFQWSTTSRDVKDGDKNHITREPEQVKAFRDTWRDGIHSYLTYFRDRLTVARDLLTDSGSIFVQIGDENVHKIRLLMEEIFGDSNFISQISVQKVTGVESNFLTQNCDYIIWFAKDIKKLKYKKSLNLKYENDFTSNRYDQLDFGNFNRRPMTKKEKENPKEIKDAKRFQLDNILSSEFRPDTTVEISFENKIFFPGNSNHWKTSVQGMNRLWKSSRLCITSKNSLRYVRMLEDYLAIEIGNSWLDISASVQSRADPKIYVVQTSSAAVQRCVLMATDPGDLVLDPTCGSGTTAYVAEQWGRRWITIDTSRVALALARGRLMGARYPYYMMADSPEGQLKEAEVSRKPRSSAPTRGNIRHGFVYERVPHITLKSIANNTEIDVIWDRWQEKLVPLLENLNKALGVSWREWEVPREDDKAWSEGVRKLHKDWWECRIKRQREMDESIAARAEFEFLYDKPYEDKKKVRVAGPFTVESVSPHRMMIVGEDEELIDPQTLVQSRRKEAQSFEAMVLENLKHAGVQQIHKEDRIKFESLEAWPGEMVCASGRYVDGEGSERKAAVMVGPEFGTVSRADLVSAAREAADGGFDVLISCAFGYEAHTDMNKLGRLAILKARMSGELHMAGDLKSTGKGNLFVVFGEPDFEILKEADGKFRVKIRGVDVFDPMTGEVRSDDADGIACWFLDTNYNQETFFVRHAYFLGANDPYQALKTTLKAEVNEEAWETLRSDTSRAFERPKTGRIAIKVINHLGDEVLKVVKVP